MKVIYILDSFPGISETFVLNEILEMQRKGVTIEVCSFSKTQHSKTHLKVKDVHKVYYFVPNQYIRKVLAHFYWVCKAPVRYFKIVLLALWPSNSIGKVFLWHLDYVLMVSRQKPDHIHAHFGRKSSDFAMLVFLLTGIGFSFTTHGYDIFNKPAKNYKLKSSLSRKHITVSQYNKNYIKEKFNVRPENIYVIHCGVDFNRILPRNNYAKNLIVAIARLVKLKGLDNLIKACSDLKKDGFSFECLIAGEGPERNALESLINKLDLKSEVKLLGNLTQDEIFGLLTKAKLKVLPSRSESMGVALMEAMMMKVPVIGPKVKGVPELIQDGENGFLIEPDDVPTLVNRMKILLSDNKLRERFSENAYQKVFKDFNLETETNKLLTIWENAS